MEKAEAIRGRRFESIINERYDFFDKEKMKENFLDFFKSYATNKSHRNLQAFRHFALFTCNKCSFLEVNLDLCNKFRDYLINDAVSFKSADKTSKLHINTASLYWSTLKEVLFSAYKKHLLQENYSILLDNISKIPTCKEHLSQDDLIRLAATPCKSETQKRAFLFSCLTGLRFSDVKALTWDNLQPYGDGSIYIKLRMQKTKQFVNNPVSSEALELIGYGREGNVPEELVFPGMKVSLTQTILPKWLIEAGISKHITLHSSRHTFGSLQVEAGTSIYVVHKMMAHRNIATTQIYSELSDVRKRESIDKITLKPKRI